MDDMSNPLEDIKVSAALKSEKMKLEYRKANKPEDINILDYTVIESLKKQIPKKITRTDLSESYKCPNCGKHRFWKDCFYCKDCGQKLEW